MENLFLVLDLVFILYLIVLLICYSVRIVCLTSQILYSHVSYVFPFVNGFCSRIVVPAPLAAFSFPEKVAPVHQDDRSDAYAYQMVCSTGRSSCACKACVMNSIATAVYDHETE
ncbi:hypothetical protein TetV_579 [Tetraselmis virus 1]|uniref:Uncharacterized protein n=1 Tax=Tetraselmis virus 1 TaxID=2060617 RepID=A0A2P0VP41_9VIRU|nr:hypothetical protein QJ968_gp475 [Tetraselmis virus 1]AUF82661.1 hypothetical protein TetV_579 [Tetraselmis virus 1]